ncbi:glycosyl hydrolases family 18-domain-containing protein [Phakopsora pachyrhizi]|uniref:Glycosyl hydrolases family 18-domain-containing protein n=1 Tax=Phakopsora pachyrhizi TaxID=170000 RepID=A0AAV0BWM4_PHAPC|nr:glycosyl hydrolases family 18-domain-containing protein [Phakopsora pachyrhizi]
MPTDCLSGLLIGHDWFCSDEFSSSPYANILASHQLSETGTLVQDDLSISEEFLNFKNVILEQSFHGKKVSSSEIAGPNAPLFSTCSDPASKFSSLQAVKHWISTGIPAKKLILGIPSYSYAYTLKSNKLTETKFSGDSKKTSHLFQSTTGVPPKAGKTANVGGDKDACGNVNSPGGQWLFKELSGTKKLTSNAKKGLGGFERHYNSCTQTVLDIFLRNFSHSSPLNQSYLEKHQPFIFNPETCSLISYNDPTSFIAKANFVLRHGLSGVEVFDATGDTDDKILLRSVWKVLA